MPRNVLALCWFKTILSGCIPHHKLNGCSWYVMRRDHIFIEYQVFFLTCDEWNMPNHFIKLIYNISKAKDTSASFCCCGASTPYISPPPIQCSDNKSWLINVISLFQVLTTLHMYEWSKVPSHNANSLLWTIYLVVFVQLNIYGIPYNKASYIPIYLFFVAITHILFA